MAPRAPFPPETFPAGFGAFYWRIQVRQNWFGLVCSSASPGYDLIGSIISSLGPGFNQRFPKEKIKSLPWSYLQTVCKRPIRQGKSPSYANEEGLICIKPKNTNEMIVSLDETSFINISTKDEVASQRLQRGDIVITRSGSGTIGRASIFLSDEEVYTNDHLFIVRTDSADSHYTCSFLNTYWGQRLLEAGISGSTGQLNLSNEHIKSITLFTPNELAQKYIGDKVRQAERLRAWAMILRFKAIASLNELLLNYSPTSIIDLNSQKKLSLSVKVKSNEIDDRLDAWFYKPEFAKAARVIEELKKSGFAIKRIAEIATVEYGFMPLEDYWNDLEGHPFLRVTNIEDHLKLSDNDIKFVNPKESNNEKFRLKEDDILIVQLGNSTGRVAYISEKYTNWAYPSFSLRVRVTSSEFDSAFVALFLSEKLGQNQINRTISITSVRPNTTKPAIESISLPQFNLDDQHVIGNFVRIATIADELSSSLTRTAKLLVETLIEGQLSEAELIAAEQALQADNNQLDRQILNRLKTDGIDGQGQALFSDLDQLYSLLQQASHS